MDQDRSRIRDFLLPTVLFIGDAIFIFHMRLSVGVVGRGFLGRLLRKGFYGGRDGGGGMG